jgi:hypothetical protein
MSYRTVEVELSEGRIWARGEEPLPTKARALLTILELTNDPAIRPKTNSEAGIRRFLSSPDFQITSEQFRASMELDFFEQ